MEFKESTYTKEEEEEDDDKDDDRKIKEGKKSKQREKQKINKWLNTVMGRVQFLSWLMHCYLVNMHSNSFKCSSHKYDKNP